MPISIPWMKIIGFLFRFIYQKGAGWDRVLILVASLALAMIVYMPLVDQVAPGWNVLRAAYHAAPPGHKAVFRSGSTAGFYHAVGKALATETMGAQTHVENIPTSGGSYGILSEVISGDESAFALVQENYITPPDLPAGRVQRIASLYEEKLHIVYDVAKWSATKGGKKNPDPRLSPSPDEATRNFFKDSTIRFTSRVAGDGPISQGELLMGLADLTYKESVSCSMSDVFDAMTTCTEKCDFDVAFVTVGTPHKKMNDSLGDGSRFGLISVEPKLASLMIQQTRKPYRFSKFAGDYHERFDHVWTVGIDAVLIASRDVAQFTVRDVMSTLMKIVDKNSKQSIGQSTLPDMGEGLAKAALSAVPRAEETRLWILSSMLFVVFVIGSILLVNCVVSIGKGIAYTHDITKIYKEKLPTTEQLDSKEGPMPLPLMELDPTRCRENIKNITLGLAKLVDLTMKIRDDYASGGITTSHHRYLIDEIYSIRGIFQSHLAARLRHAIEREVPIDMDKLQRLRVANYITAASFHELAQLLGSPEPPAGGAVGPGAKGQLLALFNWGDAGP